MFKQLTYKKKNRILLAGIIISVFVMYSFTFKKTFLLVNEYHLNKKKLELAFNAPSLANSIKAEIEDMNVLIGNSDQTEDEKEQGLLELLTNYCQDNNSVLREFPEPVITNSNDFILSTQTITMEGDFSSLIGFVYILEQKERLGKVASVDYSMKKDNKTKEMCLTATIYLQNLKRTKNEN